MLDNIVVYGGLTTLLVVIFSLASIIFSINKYHPNNRLIKKSLDIFIFVFILFLALSQIVLSYYGTGNEEVTEVDLYKGLYWVEDDDSDFALKNARKMWELNSEPDFKYILAMSFLKSQEVDKSIPLVKEVKSQLDDLQYLDKKEVSSFIKQIEAQIGNLDEQGLNNPLIQLMDVRLIEDHLGTIKEKLADRIDDFNQKELYVLTKIDLNRVDYYLKENIDTVKEREIVDVYNDMIKREDLPRTIAESTAEMAIYLNDTANAEKILVEIVTKEADSQKASLLLSSLFLQENSINTTMKSNLPQYSMAKVKAELEKRNLLEDWLKDYYEDENFKQVLDQVLKNISNQELQINRELAYSLLKSLPDKNDPQVNFLLSKYFYLIGNEEMASEYIQELLEYPDRLSKSQQYKIQELKNLPVDIREMNTEQFNQKNELTIDIYKEFEPEKIVNHNLDSQDHHFSIFLSDQIVTLGKKRIIITSVNPKDGEIELFLRTENISDLEEKETSLYDNNLKIEDFKIEKLNESDLYTRSIMMIIDKSGSMDGEPITVAKMASENFINSKRENEKIGILAFSNSTELIYPISNDKIALINSINNIRSGGGTNIAPSFYSAINYLKQEQGEKVVFILSDGEDDNFTNVNTRKEIIEMANWEGITIFSIGFGAGYVTLRDVSESTGGIYIPVSNMNELIRSFAEINKTLEKTYKITYSLDKVAPGEHTVKVVGTENTWSTIKYHIGEEQESMEKIDEDIVVEEITPGKLTIKSIAPNRIVQSKKGVTTITLNGKGFENIQKIYSENKEIEFNRIDSQNLSFNLSNNLPIGVKEFTIISEDNREERFYISIVNSEGQDSMKFGFATLYGDFIEKKGNQYEIIGNPSIDHFIYENTGKMVLRDEQNLIISGLKVKINQVPVDISGINKYDTHTMSKADNNRTFKITKKNGEQSIQVPVLAFELNVLNPLIYKANYDAKPGSLIGKAGFKNVKLKGLLDQDSLKKEFEFLKFVPNDFNVELVLKHDDVKIKGNVKTDISINRLVSIKGLGLNVDYQWFKNKLIFGMDFKVNSRNKEFGNMDLFGKNLDYVKLIEELGFEIGFENSMIPSRLGFKVGSLKGIALGTTGLQVNKGGIVADWSSSNEAGLMLGVSTIAEASIKKSVEILNSIPGIKIPDDCFLCIEGDGKIKKFGDPNWSAQGRIKGKVLSFQMVESKVLVNSNEVSWATDINPLFLTGSVIILLDDPNFQNYTSIQLNGSFDKPQTGQLDMFDGNFKIVIVPKNPEWSYVVYHAYFGNFGIRELRFGSELDVIR